MHGEQLPRQPQKGYFHDPFTSGCGGIQSPAWWETMKASVTAGKPTLSPSSTSQSFSSVAGLKTGNFLPLTELCHSLFMKICREGEKGGKQTFNEATNLMNSFINLEYYKMPT